MAPVTNIRPKLPDTFPGTEYTVYIVVMVEIDMVSPSRIEG